MYGDFSFLARACSLLTGLDNISARLLRDSASVIAPSLRYIINLSLESGGFPSSWKCAKVTDLINKVKKLINNNYSPKCRWLVVVIYRGSERRGK